MTTSKPPSRGRRLKIAAIVSASVSFGVVAIFFIAGELASLGDDGMYHMARIEAQDAINATCILFWIALGVFLVTYIRQGEAAQQDERLAHMSGMWLDRRRSTLLKARSRRR